MINHLNSSTFTLLGVSFPATMLVELGATDLMIVAFYPRLRLLFQSETLR